MTDLARPAVEHRENRLSFGLMSGHRRYVKVPRGPGGGGTMPFTERTRSLTLSYGFEVAMRISTRGLLLQANIATRRTARTTVAARKTLLLVGCISLPFPFGQFSSFQS